MKEEAPSGASSSFFAGFVTSGVRLGTPAVTTRGMGVAEMKVIADCIADCIWHYDEKKDEISDRVLKLTRDFPLYQ